MKRNRWALAAGAVLIAVIGGVLLASHGTRARAATSTQSVGTARVERRTLSAMTSQGGILTYRARPDGSPYSVINQVQGTYTMLPAVGQVLSQGHVLYRVNDRPIVLLHGPTPAYRSLEAGATGPDVAELNADLVALGYATSAQLRPQSVFSLGTTTAVEKLQAALGMPRTGTLSLGQVVFEPVALRVTSVPVQPGGGAQPGGPVLQATSTTREVRVALDASQQTSMAVGDRVTITLPNNRNTPGVVSSVARVASCSSSAAAGGPNAGTSSATAGTDSCSGGSEPTITVDVVPAHPAATGTWDEAPVHVGITTESVPDALVVPVTALLARAGGGYAVEVVGAGPGNHLVAVSLGLFDDADGLVQVTGRGLAAGQAVVVPST